jgi:hypothetical protein
MSRRWAEISSEKFGVAVKVEVLTDIEQRELPLE